MRIYEDSSVYLSIEYLRNSEILRVLSLSVVSHVRECAYGRKTSKYKCVHTSSKAS